MFFGNWCGILLFKAIVAIQPGVSGANLCLPVAEAFGAAILGII